MLIDPSNEIPDNRSSRAIVDNPFIDTVGVVDPLNAQANKEVVESPLIRNTGVHQVAAARGQCHILRGLAGSSRGQLDSNLVGADQDLRVTSGKSNSPNDELSAVGVRDSDIAITVVVPEFGLLVGVLDEVCAAIDPLGSGFLGEDIKDTTVPIVQEGEDDSLTP